MAVTSLWPIKSNQKLTTIKKVIDYARNPEKTVERDPEALAPLHAINGVVEYAANEMKTETRAYVSCFNCTSEETAATESMQVKEFWRKTDGRLSRNGKKVKARKGRRPFGSDTPCVIHLFQLQGFDKLVYRSARVPFTIRIASLARMRLVVRSNSFLQRNIRMMHSAVYQRQKHVVKNICVIFRIPFVISVILEQQIKNGQKITGGLFGAEFFEVVDEPNFKRRI